MLDISFIRENPEEVKQALYDRQVELDLDAFLNLDSRRRSSLQHLETKRALRNSLSEAIAEVADSERASLIEEARQVKNDIKDLEKEFDVLDKEYHETLIRIPNVPSKEMPVGKGEEDNAVLKVWLPKEGYLDVEGADYTDVSYMPQTSFKYKDHVELGKDLDLIDVEQSAIVSGSRFYYLKNEAVLLQEAVFALLKNKLLKEGYMPMISPLLVKEKSLFGTSHFPEGRDQIYKIESFNVEDKNELYLVGSSEPSNFSYFMDKKFSVEELPIKVFVESTCFRSEVGSWGKDVRGIKRVHQFDKVEMNTICTPAKAREVFDEYLAINEWMLQELKLPYRIISKCTGDAGYNASHLQFDWDYWRPGEREFMEGGTDTWATDYQARRLGIRYEADDEAAYVHTVNDTGATTRVIIAILENYQQEDGSILIPEALHPYVGGLEKISHAKIKRK
ncbi:serine--tRNA ligase [candidate division WWE3 bacterium]|nr:serine--tRNA ligase [candidate division WWE3 bacterium]